MQVIRRSVTAVILAAALVQSAAAIAASGEPGTAWVENRSTPTQCAEFDNVYYTMTDQNIGRFRIDVSAPVYLADLAADDTGPNFANCEAMKEDPKNHFTPKQITLYDDGQTRIVGHTYAESWRARGAEVIVGDTDESDLHLVQLFEKVDGAFVEYLVVYPFDGYWRAKPIPTTKFPNAAYGTSFLVGPVEQQHRPIVDISKLEIDPKTKTFRMTFAKGGTGSLKVLAADQKHILLDVTLDGLSKEEPPLPFAAIRSMFVSPTNADTARVTWRTDTGLYNQPVMDFKDANASEVRFDRIELSKHNTSAPDVTFSGFASPPPAR
ncbi:hypothetical protein [Hansschlegelia plantiphila]|uniref:Uncharacterized protein n=1 Tax=Hansschlegelia plantiphila TaxID=374655 RepID=A0A9W6MV94_9HYPH|nr:hypothetical protein [Hansschlegelia plantiphila]GLK68229.1 hypothetical protein GCM10008179_18670 [Hansschlegelia plantiphila]